MVSQGNSLKIKQLASKLLRFYLATGKLPSAKEHQATPCHFQQALSLLTRNGYISNTVAQNSIPLSPVSA
ncbi:hypothetical protein A9Q99_10280 [Gammaproteobacteria bacterium 45_16_T64]|nr:hypothetical protein A9Q99_10280 [Gammaproteobacteria bacterium 45_16_T64]